MVQIRLSVNLFRLSNPNQAYKFPRTFLTPEKRMAISKELAKEEGDLAKKLGQLNLKELDPQPEYIAYREKLWEKYKASYSEDLKNKSPSPIKVSAKDKEGNCRDVEAESWKTTPLEVARKIHPKSWCESIVISKVDGKLWDLERPLESNCAIEFITFEDDEGKAVFWHSTAHVLGEALERLYGSHLCYGPPIESGFYYDMYMTNPCCAHDGQAASGDQKSDVVDNDGAPHEGPASTVSKTHFPTIEEVMKKVCNEKQLFERLELTKDQLLEMFNYNQFKVRILNEKVKEERTTVYRCGSLIDLCLGPHIRHTGLIKAFKVTKSSSTFWEGDQKSEHLQRVYGISFPQEKQLKEWIRLQEEAALRDHRKVGRDQQLFFFHEYSRGSAIFSPNGTLIYNNLMDFIRKEYRKRGFTEVITPNIYNVKLWEISGHWQHYSENMFSFEIEQEKYALKPMNCPGHCLIFDSETRSWKDMPVRFADFGVLHRNELSGCLTGLTRVRRFQQDDAHIFCTYEQIEDEIVKALKFMEDVYSVLGFTFDMVLSTRPDSFIGDVEVWNNAEEALKNALNASKHKWGLNPGDGAFYGPKIDVTVKDALQRSHQCATIQLDFQLPIRFNLAYIDPTGEKKRPCIIHRAIFGSVERFLAILTENFGGKWPFWLSPHQAMVIPISDQFRDYAEEVRARIYGAGFEAYKNADMTESFNKKVRNAQLERYNFILVVGAKEKANNTVNVRTRDNTVHGESSLDHLIGEFHRFKENKTLQAESEFKAKV